MTIPLRSAATRKHIHIWTITKDVPARAAWHYTTGFSIHVHRYLERTCTGCGERQSASVLDERELPPTALLALAELEWK